MWGGIDPWAAAQIVDVGDVPLPRANDNEACIADITEFYKGHCHLWTAPFLQGFSL